MENKDEMKKKAREIGQNLGIRVITETSLYLLMASEELLREATGKSLEEVRQEIAERALKRLEENIK